MNISCLLVSQICNFNRSKSRENSPRNSNEKLETTEKNRLLFKYQKFGEEEPVRKRSLF